jgi:tetraacyldisaccharide 4'-kinase
VLTRIDQAEPAALESLRRRVGKLAPGRVVAESVHRAEGLVNAAARAPLVLLRERPVAAFCGIGNAEAFRRTLTDLGARVVDFRDYPDHHAYTRADVEELRCWAGALPADVIVVTTQKDLVKLRLPDLAARPLWALRIRLAFQAGQPELDRLLGQAAAFEEGPRANEAT